MNEFWEKLLLRLEAEYAVEIVNEFCEELLLRLKAEIAVEIIMVNYLTKQNVRKRQTNKSIGQLGLGNNKDYSKKAAVAFFINFKFLL